MMRCSECGAENAESAEFCSLCMQRLKQPASPSPQGGYGAAAGGGHVAPGEWRGDADALRPEVSGVVTSRVHRYRVKMLVLVLVVAAIVFWLVLSFTVWGNPSPGEVSEGLLDAANARDREAFIALFEEMNRPAAGELYAALTARMGARGRYENVEFDVVVNNDYDAVAYLESADLVSGDDSKRPVTRSDNLMVVMENHGGRWYVVPRGTSIMP